MVRKTGNEGHLLLHCTEFWDSDYFGVVLPRSFWHELSQSKAV